MHLSVSISQWNIQQQRYNQRQCVSQLLSVRIRERILVQYGDYDGHQLCVVDKDRQRNWQRLEQCKRAQTTKVAFRAPAKETLGGEETYRRAAAAAVLIGSAYKCDKCTRWHNSLASGVVVDPDGVVATNHHVAAGPTGEAMGVLTAACPLSTSDAAHDFTL